MSSRSPLATSTVKVLGKMATSVVDRIRIAIVDGVQRVLVLVGIASAVLIGAWLVALRAHLRRQRSRAAEWDGAQERPDLWTSTARCLSCGGGGVIEEDGDALWFVCLTCGRRHARQTRG
jgi:hypothetical protein